MQGIPSRTGLDSILNHYAPGGQNQVLTTIEGSGPLGLKFTVIPPRSPWMPNFIGVIIDAARSALSLDKPEVAALALFRRNLVDKFGQTGAEIANSLKGRHITVGAAQSALRQAEAHVLIHQKYQEILGTQAAQGSPSTEASQKTAWQQAEAHVGMHQRFQKLDAMKGYAATTAPGADVIDRNTRQFFSINRDTGTATIKQAHSRSFSSASFDPQGVTQAGSSQGSRKSDALQALTEKIHAWTRKELERLPTTVKGEESNPHVDILEASMVSRDISRQCQYMINGQQLVAGKDVHGKPDAGRFAQDARALLPEGPGGDEIFLAFCSFCNQDSLNTMEATLMEKSLLNLMPTPNRKGIDPIAFEVSDGGDGSWHLQCAMLQQVGMLADISDPAGGQATLESPGELLKKIDCQVKFADGKAYIASITADLILTRSDPAQGAA